MLFNYLIIVVNLITIIKDIINWKKNKITLYILKRQKIKKTKKNIAKMQTAIKPEKTDPEKQPRGWKIQELKVPYISFF